MPEVYRTLENVVYRHPASGSDTADMAGAPRGVDSVVGNGGGRQKTRQRVVGLQAGWLIAKKPDTGVAGAAGNDQSPRCLQLATGQWCSSDWATWFPGPGPAIVYASELGYQIGQSVEIIYLKRDC